MSAPGLRRLSLGDLDSDPNALTRLLGEDESLFVEHKTDIAKGKGFQLAKAAASFANTLGGWILVGVRGGRPTVDWKPPRGGFVDAVRQRLEGQLDPLPSFAARVIEHEGSQIGVVRVYESADTPHILSADGSIVVREPAQDAKLRQRGRYEATPIRSHYELLQLTQRGREAQAAADARFDAGRLPWIDDTLELEWTVGAGRHGPIQTISSAMPAVVVRLSPLTTDGRWQDWSISHPAAEALGALASAIVGGAQANDPLPHPRGVAVSARQSQSQKWTPGGKIRVNRRATAALDAGGVLGVRLGFELIEGGGLVNYWRELGRGEPVDELIRPLISGLCGVLGEAEQLGRFAAHVLWLRFSDLYRVEPSEPRGAPPGFVPGSGQVTVDGGADLVEIRALAQGWAEELARASGVAVWRS